MTVEASNVEAPAAEVTETDIANAQQLAGMAGLLKPAAIRAAATLGLADHIAAGATSAGDLARETGADPEALGKLLRYLAAIGILRLGEGGDYQLTDLGQPLRGDFPLSLRDQLSSDGIFGHAELGLVNILHTVRTGEVCHEGFFGRPYWVSVNEDPSFRESLEKSAQSQLVFDAQLIVEEYDWSGVQTVVDVGGNVGTLLMELVRRHGHLRGTVVDLRNTAEIAGRRFAAAGLEDRCQAVVGDFFEELPAGADVYLLSAILADWDDEAATQILRRCAEAAGPDGKVLLAEVSLPPMGEQQPDEMATGSDLYIAGMVDSPVRTVPELVKLGEAAGLQRTWEGSATAVRSLIEFAPRPA